MKQDRGLRRFPTGLEPLDRLLGGGWPAYAVVILAGEPGTGKTIFSQQSLFANAARGGKGLYLTTVSESPMKAARYQAEFSFFDPAQFGESVVYMDVGETIRREDLGKAVEVIAAALREHQPNLVVVDSFRAIHDLATGAREARTFAYDLAVELSAIQATTILVGEYEEGDIGRMPEFAVADGIIWLSLERTRTAARRHLRILKMRGVSHSTIPFSFDICSSGISLYALPRVEPSGTPHRGRVPTGDSGLDLLFRGGIPAACPVLVSGESGTGKSTLCLQYLVAGAERGEKGLYVSYEEPPEQIIANGRNFGWDVQGLVDRGLLRFEHTPLPRVNPEAEIVRIDKAVGELGATLAVVDSLTMLVHHVDRPDEVRQHVYDLSTILRGEGCTPLIVTDPPAGSGLISRFGVEESILDGVIVLKTTHEGRGRNRYLEIHKMRGVEHASGEHLMRIAKGGIRVFPRSEEMVR